MGKETKIGLVVIGILLIAFGGLLIRKFAALNGNSPIMPVARAAGPPPSTAASEKPAVSLVQKDPAADTVSPAGMWSATGRDSQADSQSGGEAPHRNFLPVDPAAADAQAPPSENRSAAVRLPAVDEPEQPTGGSNPFAAGTARPEAVQELSPDAREQLPQAEGSSSDIPALEIPSQAPAESAESMRRLGSQEPIQVADRGAPESADENQSATDLRTADEPITDGPITDEPVVDVPARREPPAASTRASSRVEQPLAATEPPAREDSRYETTQPSRPTVAHEEPVQPPLVDGKYTIQPNDNLWVISEKVYGTGGYFKALYEHNRLRLQRPDQLVVNTILVVPPIATLEKNYPALCPKQRKSAVVKASAIPASTRGRRSGGANAYVVAEGDTLFDIARYELGKASRWAEIYELNRDVLGEDYDHLRPGTELVMPARSQATDSFTRQNDRDRYQR
jgi:nucleoid-associated protein YgaU